MIIMTSHSDYLEVIQDYVELEKLPACVAPGIGKGKAMPGYFENIHLEGGPIPDPDDLAVRKSKDVISKQLGRQETTMSTTSVSTVASDISVSGKLMLKGYWEDDHPSQTGSSIIRAFPASSGQTSSLGA